MVKIEVKSEGGRLGGKENVVTSGRTRDVDGLRLLLNVLERSLDTAVARREEKRRER